MPTFLADLYGRFLRWSGLEGNFSRLTFAGQDVQWIAVVLERTTHCLTHAGIAYRDDVGGPLRVLHLGSHLGLRSELCAGSHIFALPDMLEEDQQYLAGFCRLIYRANGKDIPYAFEYDPDILFDRGSGLITTQDAGSGLSCATFVAAVFRSSGNPLINLATWPAVASDIDVTDRQEVLRLWREAGQQSPRHKFLSDRADVIEPSIRARRVRPDHVSAACLQDRRRKGASYKRCERDGQRVLEVLDSKFPRPSS